MSETLAPVIRTLEEILHCVGLRLRPGSTLLSEPPMGSTMVRNNLGMEVRSGHLFLLANSRRTKLKILYWDRTAFLLVVLL
jgi:hypothetical protein